MNGVLYVLGGEKADYSANTSFYREESDGSWTSLGTVPGGSWISSSATTRITSLWEELLLVVDTSNPTAYSYNTSSDAWSTLGSFSVPYQFTTGSFLGYEDMIDFNDDMTYMSAKVEGDYIYIVGQYKVSGGGMFGGEYVYSTRLFYYNGSSWSSPSWSVDAKRRWCPALAVYGDRLYVIGGTEDGTAEKMARLILS